MYIYGGVCVCVCVWGGGGGGLGVIPELATLHSVVITCSCTYMYSIEVSYIALRSVRFFLCMILKGKHALVMSVYMHRYM